MRAAFTNWVCYLAIVAELHLFLLGIGHCLALYLRCNLFEVLVSELHSGHLEIVVIFPRKLRLLLLLLRCLLLKLLLRRTCFFAWIWVVIASIIDLSRMLLYTILRLFVNLSSLLAPRLRIGISFGDGNLSGADLLIALTPAENDLVVVRVGMKILLQLVMLLW